MSKILSFSLYVLKNWYKWWVQLLTIIGNIKVFKTPCFVQYNPEEYDYKVRGYQIRDVCKNIKAGDVILRGYDHYLDGWLIPGEFSHAGVYIGNDTIIHAVSDGVKEIDTIDFMQCDRLMVLRPKSGAKNAIKFVKDAIGEEYDFKFNSSDSSEFYCFELAAKAYPKLNITPITVELFGYKLAFLTEKYTAESFISNTNFEVVYKVVNS